MDTDEADALIEVSTLTFAVMACRRLQDGRTTLGAVKTDANPFRRA